MVSSQWDGAGILSRGVADDVLAPGYVNLASPGVDIAGMKAMTTALHPLIGEARTNGM